MMVARDPARFGSAKFGKSRFGVYQAKWERQFRKMKQRSFTRYRYVRGNPDSTTGIRTPDYSNSSTINGILRGTGQVVAGFPAGTICLYDAELASIDVLTENDRLVDPQDNNEYHVKGEPLRGPADRKGGGTYLISQLRKMQIGRVT